MDCLEFDEAGPGDKGQLHCEPGEEISIENAWYGRTSTSECSAGNEDNNGTYDSMFYQICDTPMKVTRDVAIRCDGKETCEFRGAGSFSFDPCVNTHKYTKIFYNCIRK